MNSERIALLTLTLLSLVSMISFPTVAAACVDADGDGYGSPGDASCPSGNLPDCDNTRIDVHPGALEVCDGSDNDCNGIVDDGFDVGVPCNVPGAIRNRFVSDATWEVFADDPAGPLPVGPIGFAQSVCLDASHPANCPANATLYGWPFGGWSVGLSDLPGARWIWAPGITGQSPAPILEDYFFQKTFQFLCSPSGIISVAVDNLAEVRVNGTPVGTHGSTNNEQVTLAAQSFLKTFDISSQLVSGANILTIKAQQGDENISQCCTYSVNPAGVVFGGSFTIDGPPEDCDCGIWIDEDGTGQLRMNWISHAVEFGGLQSNLDVASGVLSELRADGGVFSRACALGSFTNTTQAVDTRTDPAAGDGYYYLISGTCALPIGWGNSSSGPRIGLPPSTSCVP